MEGADIGQASGAKSQICQHLQPPRGDVKRPVSTMWKKGCELCTPQVLDTIMCNSPVRIDSADSRKSEHLVQEQRGREAAELCPGD